jgi:glyoxylase-like metal-dependent hydrolase (beta-lactamase superfamily II)
MQKKNEEIRTIDLGMVNAFLAEAGDGFILVDTGVTQQWTKLEKILLKEGCLPSKIKLVIVTHGDSDHSGNCAALQKKHGIKIAMHRDDSSIVKTGIPCEHQARGVLGKLMLALIKSTNKKTRFDTFEPNIFLNDGQHLVEYGIDARIIHTPGHTRGSLAIITARGNLLVGDTVSNRMRPGLAPFFQDRNEMIASLDKLKKLGAKTVYPGHGKPFGFNELLKIT